MKSVFISDTHNKHDQVNIPECDILFHCGDITGRGTIQEAKEFLRWFSIQPAKHKVYIAGNHDFAYEDESKINELRKFLPGIYYLHNSGITLEGLNIWGSPCTPFFHDWAFNIRTNWELANIWKKIPENTDILLTHGPPQEILDRTWDGENVGCKELAKRVIQVAPKIHAFGHIHEGYGQLEYGGIHFINAATCNLRYQPVNSPIVIDL